MSDAGSNVYRDAAAKYRPDAVRLLFVAEAPPTSVERYFYFPRVPVHDSLWIETMRAMYGTAFGEAAFERGRKDSWLRRFQGDGCFLIDAMDEPISGSPRTRLELIRKRAADSAREAAALQPKQVLLIKSTVYEGLAAAYRNAGLPVVNQGPVPFPGSGQQEKFRAEIASLVNSGRLNMRGPA